MKDGFIPVEALTPELRVADVAYNTAAALAEIERACAAGAKVVVLPELCLTGYTCEDLFAQTRLIEEAKAALARVAKATEKLDALVVVGAPVRLAAKLYNCACIFSAGTLLGIVPKRVIPTYNEFYEGRHFVAGPAEVSHVSYAGFSDVPFGSSLLFKCQEMPGLVLGVEICEDLWAPAPPSIAHAQAGATLICNLSASNEVVGKADYRRDLVRGQSARLVCAYVYADAGQGESTTDLVFAGHDLICENGRTLAEALPFGASRAHSEIDLGLIAAERQRLSSFEVAPTPEAAGYTVVPFALKQTTTMLTRPVDAAPFVPGEETRRRERCETILSIQTAGLAKRLEHTKSQHAVVGISGGLDSTLALLVSVRAFDALSLPRQGIVAITMPGFGTTERTHSNAADLASALGVELREISIADAVRQHFAAIGHDEDIHDVVYENAQARERTQILMDVANELGGLVVGTGDLSELALGWATYNGDHMSNYAVNAGVPKTLVRHLVRYVADTCGDEALSQTLTDVLATPVSPELLPADSDGTIAQKTEDLVGPYELHDFFLYEMLRHGASPRKILRLAEYAFAGTYDRATILSWLTVFYRRFFAQQFKRSCLPDGPKVGTVAVSPRGDLRMPSDAAATAWLAELEELEAPRAQ